MPPRGFKVPKGPFGSFTPCNWHALVQKKRGHSSLHTSTTKWLSQHHCALSIFWIKYFSYPPAPANPHIQRHHRLSGVASVLVKVKYSMDERTSMMHFWVFPKIPSCSTWTEAPKLNRKFLLTMSFGQFPPVGGEYKYYSPKPRERKKLLTEMSSHFKIIHISLLINSQGLGRILYLTALGIKAESYSGRMTVFTND